QALRDQAHLMTVEQGNALDLEVQGDSRRMRTLLSTLIQQMLTDADDLERGLSDVLSTVGTSDGDLEIGAVLDLQTGRVRQRQPSRTTIASLTDEQLEQVRPGNVQGQRVVPLQDGG